MKTKLDTMQDVHSWACDQVGEDAETDFETAAYLAECVRLRQAYDAGYNSDNYVGMSVPGALETYYDSLWDAMKGGSDEF